MGANSGEEKDAGYDAFERVIEQTLKSAPLRIGAYCQMPNHWSRRARMVWPRADGDRAAFLQKLTITQVRRWQEQQRVVGTGHVYQSRYKSLPVETDENFYQVVRYVKRNALRAGLVDGAERWRWGSLWRRVSGSRQQSRRPGILESRLAGTTAAVAVGETGEPG